jgi:hypothetical protein
MKFNKIDMKIYSEVERNSMIYLLKYKDKYKVIQSEDGTYEIICNFGKSSKASICVHNFPLKNQEGINTLKFCLTLGNGSRNAFLIERKLLERGIELGNTEFFANGECTIDFLEKDLPKVEGILKIKKKRQLSEERKQQLRDNLAKVREAQNEREKKVH